MKCPDCGHWMVLRADKGIDNRYWLCPNCDASMKPPEEPREGE